MAPQWASLCVVLALAGSCTTGRGAPVAKMREPIIRLLHGSGYLPQNTFEKYWARYGAPGKRIGMILNGGGGLEQGEAAFRSRASQMSTAMGGVPEENFVFIPLYGTLCPDTANDPAVAELIASLDAVYIEQIIESQTDLDPTIHGVPLGDALDQFDAAEPVFTRLPFDHPLYVLFSSGTTGKPKPIVHRAGGVLLTHMKEQQLACDIRPGDRVFYFTTTGWMMWNWLATVMANQAAIVVYDGSPAHPTLSRLFSLIDDIGITFFGTSAKFIETLLKADISISERHGLASMRTLASTGSPLSPEGFAHVYNEIASDVHLLSMSGGTDLCGCLVSGDPNGPVFTGQIQRPVLGMAIDVFDDMGRAVGSGVQGELVCTRSFPSMPLTFLGEGGRDRYLAAYFERFENVWHQGDFAEWTQQGGIVIHGRSDATLNPGGVRIGTAEIYAQLEKIPDVLEGLVIGQSYDADTRIVLFVRLRDGVELDDKLTGHIRLTIRHGATPRHVPAVVVAVEDLPRTRSGKIAEIAVREIVHGRQVNNQSALANPEVLALFQNLAELME